MNIKKGLRNLMIGSPIGGFSLGYVFMSDFLRGLAYVIGDGPDFALIIRFQELKNYRVFVGIIFAIIAWNLVATVFVLVSLAER